MYLYLLTYAPGSEAPFLEFIERVCAQPTDGSDPTCPPVPIRAGCGGFGIRNFLTLFLSIEVSKAMLDRQTAAPNPSPHARQTDRRP